MPKLRNPRGTRAALNALAAGSSIEPGQIYVLVDEGRIAAGLTQTTFQTYAKEFESGRSFSFTLANGVQSDIPLLAVGSGLEILFNLADGSASNIPLAAL